MTTKKNTSPSLASFPATTWSNRLLPFLLILAAGGLAYATSFSAPFVFDDESSIIRNPAIHDLGNFLSGAGYAYNPRRFVAYLSFALNYRFGGLNVFGYHLVNLIIHIASGFLVYALASLALRAGRDRGPGTGDREKLLLVPDHWSLIPLFAALLFVVHPIQTQAVTYIVQRTASLAALFYLAAMVCYAKGREQGPGTSTQEKLLPVPGPWSPVPWFIIALISGILAIKTKENAVTLPLAIIIYEFVFYGFSKKKLLTLLAPLCLGGVVAAIGIAGSGRPLGQLISDVSEMSRQTTVISRWEYLVTQFAVIATYLRLLVLPVNQNLDYDYPLYNSLAQARPLLGLLLHLSLIAVALWCWRRAYMGTRDQGPGTSAPASPFTIHYALIAFGILWFYLTLSVESSVIPITDVIFEHRLYLPVAGAFIAVAALFDMAAAKMGYRQVAAIAGVIVIAFMATTVARNSVWKSQISIWSDAVQKAPGKGRPRVNLGNQLEQAGRLDEALETYREGVRLQPTVADSHNNLGAALFRRGELQEALSEYNRALALRPNYLRALNNMGIALTSMGRPTEAFSYYQKALTIDSENGETWYNLGVACMEGGDMNGAFTALNRAINLSPTSANAHNSLGNLYGMAGRADQALWHHQQAIQLDPRLDKAYLGAGSDCEAKGMPYEAERYYRQSLTINPAFHEARTSLGILLVETGRSAEGITELEVVAAQRPADDDARANLAMARKRAGML